jgi:membrane associated rhomboid family serine protease
MDALALVAAALALFAGLVGLWRWLSRRWGLSGPGAPPPQHLERDEYMARRVLRALLPFSLLVVVPSLVLLAGALGSAVGSPRDLRLAILGLVLFLVPLPFLRWRIRTLEALRARGLAGPPAAPPWAARSPWAARLPSGGPGPDAPVPQGPPRDAPTSPATSPFLAHLGGPGPFTLAAVAVILVVSVAAWLLPEEQLLMRLAKVNGAIRAGEVWRLVTVGLVHGGVLHLLANLMVLRAVGRPLERLAGGWAMLAVLVLGTAAGSVASVLLIPRPAVGASGGIFALAGALLTFGLRHRAALPPGARRGIVVATAETVAINVGITFLVPRIDWAAHVGGLAAGMLLGLLLRPGPATMRALHPAEPAGTGPPRAGAGGGA